ncbi:MAG TPA: low molecular weight protein arginine phosphatase [Candidatus Limnocylindrales bacterium]|nr:low molecular weight protein arginine phosphatase [Candidatus Limnocylindrales bacterium]
METSPPDERTFRLLFVCTGNTCRSPMAEAIARRRAEELGWSGLEVRSAGIAAYDGSPASDGAVRAAEAAGLDLSTHRSRPLTRAEAAAADLILTMSAEHLMRVVEIGGGEHAAMLTSYAGGHPDGFPASSIPDPIGGSDEEYGETFRLLEKMIDGVLERLRPSLAP